MELRIIPTIFATNKKKFMQRFNKLVKISKLLQIDIMDGKFVKLKSIDLKDIPNLKEYNIKFEAHLMVLNPEKYIKKLKQKGFKKIIFHIESINNNLEINEIIEKIKRLYLECWLAINPDTPTPKNELLKRLDGIQFMGVFPGKENQEFIERIYIKIKNLRKTNNKIKVQVDGGINLNTIKKLKKLKINFVNSGSFISNAKDSKKALEILNKEI